LILRFMSSRGSVHCFFKMLFCFVSLETGEVLCLVLEKKRWLLWSINDMWCFVDLINLIIIGGVTVALSVAIVFFFYPGLKTMIIILVGKKYMINLIWRIKLKTIKIVTKRSRKKKPRNQKKNDRIEIFIIIKKIKIIKLTWRIKLKA
jgi:hypothetical protein